MARKPKSYGNAPLAPHLVDALLLGACMDRNECQALGISPSAYDWWGWLEDDPRMNADAIARLRPLWRAHRDWLIGEARRRGIAAVWAQQQGFDDE